MIPRRSFFKGLVCALAMAPVLSGFSLRPFEKEEVKLAESEWKHCTAVWMTQHDGSRRMFLWVDENVFIPTNTIVDNLPFTGFTS